jgi:hypothetical protein
MNLYDAIKASESLRPRTAFTHSVVIILKNTDVSHVTTVAGAKRKVVYRRDENRNSGKPRQEFRDVTTLNFKNPRFATYAIAFDNHPDEVKQALGLN